MRVKFLNQIFLNRRITPTRFYEGSVYDVWSAVYPEQRGICYQVLDVCDPKKHKPAYIKLGYDRERRKS